MKRGLKKKGLHQIDWVISLGIFLLYLAWFFIFLKPQIQISSDFAPLGRAVKEDFKNDAYYHVEKYPLFFSSEKTQNSTIVFFDFNKKTNKNFEISDSKDYFYYNNKIMILSDFNNNTKYLWVIESSKNYTHINKKLGINKFNDTITTSKGISAKFENALLASLNYNNNDIGEFNFNINSHNFSTTSSNFSDYNILSEYKAETQPMTLLTRVIARNSVIWVSIEKNDADSNNNLVMQLSLLSFTDFFSDNSNFGSLSANCQEYKHNYLKLYGAKNSFLLILPENTLLSFCKESLITNLNITIKVDSQKDFFIILDSPDFKKENFTDYTTLFGAKRVINGIDLDLLSGMAYENKKTEWNIPSENNFQIIIWNSTLNNLEKRNSTLFVLGNEPLTSTQIYSDEYRDFILNNNGYLTEVTVNLKTW